MDPEDAEAVRVACPADEESFLKYLSDTRDLRRLPKAHLHIHGDAAVRNVDLKARVDGFNAQPDAAECIRKARDIKVQKSEECTADDLWKEAHLRHAEMLTEMLSGEALQVAGPFWDEQTRLRKCAYDFEELDKVSPWGGVTGFNAPGDLWHGMAGCRDYGLAKGIVNTHGPKGLDWVQYFIAASEDAKAEGIRHVEYMTRGMAPGQIMPELDEDGSFKPMSAEVWRAFRTQQLELFGKVREAVPEVSVVIVLMMPGAYDMAWVHSFLEHYKAEDAELKALVRGIGEVGAGNPAKNAEMYQACKEAGLELVNIHVGEWCKERAELVAESLSRVSAAVELGVRRIGHGIIAHVDAGLLSKIKERDVCLEVCPVSNRVLDNVPQGIAAHPLRRLFDAGVPVALAADDPAHMGSPNSHGLVREFHFARQLQGFTPAELAQLARNSFKYSLAPESIKEKAYADIDDWVKAAS